MFGILKVTGDSLAPDYREGDFVLVVKIPFLLKRLGRGDTIVFKHPDYGILIKRIDSLDTDGGEIYVTGTQPNSVDSRRFGPIRYRDVMGKVIWHIRKSG